MGKLTLGHLRGGIGGNLEGAVEIRTVVQALRGILADAAVVQHGDDVQEGDVGQAARHADVGAGEDRNLSHGLRNAQNTGVGKADGETALQAEVDNQEGQKRVAADGAGHDDADGHQGDADVGKRGRRQLPEPRPNISQRDGQHFLALQLAGQPSEEIRQRVALFDHRDGRAAEEDQEDGAGALDKALINGLKHIPRGLMLGVHILEGAGDNLRQLAFGDALKAAGRDDPG